MVRQYLDRYWSILSLAFVCVWNNAIFILCAQCDIPVPILAPVGLQLKKTLLIVFHFFHFDKFIVMLLWLVSSLAILIEITIFI